MNLQDYLAEMLVLFHHPVGIHDLDDGEDLLDDWHNGPGEPRRS